MENQPKAVILSCSGMELTREERDFFHEQNPLGFILFSRNISNKKQLKELVSSLKETVGREAPILIDQEGGKVQRLVCPEWTYFEPAAFFGMIYNNDREQALRYLYQSTKAMAKELAEVGINANCAPCLDIFNDSTHSVIGSRSFSYDARAVSDLGCLMAEALLKNGVMPIVKHMPGHGRADTDSHLELPHVGASWEDLTKEDFVPFREIAGKNIPCWGMSSHIVFSAIDKNLPVTLSFKAVDVIRNEIGFKNFMISDDISMKALKGSLDDLCRKTLEAGWDAVLYCWGRMDEMKLIMSAIPHLTENQYAKAIAPVNAATARAAG